jgi:hypothetical protein
MPAHIGGFPAPAGPAAGNAPATAPAAARQFLPGRAIAAGRLGFAVRDR